MLGAIIGDTVGSHYEFHNTKDYDFELYANPSSYTDDTVMTIAVASWLPEIFWLEETIFEKWSFVGKSAGSMSSHICCKDNPSYETL